MADLILCGKRGLPLDEDRPFDRDAARAGIFKWAGFDGDNPDPAKAGQGFVVRDRSQPEIRDSFHCPFAHVVDGALRAVPNGVRNAKSRLPQVGGISQELVNRGDALLDSYMERIHGEADSSRAPDLILTTQVRAVAGASAGTDEAELLTVARRRAPDPTVFEDHPAYLWSVQGSSNEEDSFGTRMMPSTLKNFATDAEAGVPYMRNHDAGKLNFGQSLKGRYVGPGGNGIARFFADFYTLRNWEAVDGVNTDAFITGLRGGIYSHVSVGFHSGQVRCSVCGKPMILAAGVPQVRFASDRDFCLHIPKFEYQAVDRHGKPTDEMVRATGEIEDARLAEISQVFYHSTPNAQVVKAQQLAEMGRLMPAEARFLESQYRGLHLHSYHNWPGYHASVDADGRSLTDDEPAPPVVAEGENDDGEPISPPEAPMGDIQIPEAALRAFRSLMPKERIPVEADATAVVEAATTHVRELQERLTTRDQVCKDIAQVLNEAGCTEAEIGPGVRWLLAENKRLTPLADIGRTYRADLIEDTLKEGVAADGNAFAREMWSGVLGRASLEEIKAIRSTFTAKADAKVGGGGRKIDDRPGEPGTNHQDQRQDGAPAALFRM